ncbi:FAD-dependent monooxygenase [Streptomyces catenulae]|uniref:FAD-dependent monooxygenase n=1 Tax=Streptomyces catenulae TaxID=66875 RepID=A0ABV2YTZ8_9ACTN|nr:FAD-dependent monooxygenase [Streptomyces catenulae]
MALNNVKDTSVAATAAALPTSEDPGDAVDVLIAGAGPTGLALAIDLTRRGLRALVVERQQTLSPGARGTGHQPRSLEVYDDLGLLDAMQAGGGPYPEIGVWRDGRLVESLTAVERYEPTPATPYANILMVPLFRTVKLFHDRLRELGGEVRFGTELTTFSQDTEGVTATLRGPDGVSRPVRARYLVAADGGRSTVRRALGITMSGPSLEEGAALLADVRVEGLDRDHWHRWVLPGEFGGVMMLPLARTDLFQVFVIAPDETPDPSEEGTRAALARHTHLTPEQIREVRWTSVYRPRAARADTFRSGRVFLTGDAAHIHSPAGGQGLNTGVQDAYNLGWKLGQVLRHGAPDTLLDSYEAERLPIADHILDTSTRLHRDRNWRRSRDLHQLGIGYPDSPLTQELRPHVPESVPHAGDRAPDAPCTTPDGAPVRLFDLLRGPHFTLLALGDVELDTAALPADPTLLRTVRAAGPSPDLLDPHGHLRDAYGPDAALYLIRPDGYITWAAPAEGAPGRVAEALRPFLGDGALRPVG